MTLKLDFYLEEYQKEYLLGGFAVKDTWLNKILFLLEAIADLVFNIHECKGIDWEELKTKYVNEFEFFLLLGGLLGEVAFTGRIFSQQHLIDINQMGGITDIM